MEKTPQAKRGGIHNLKHHLMKYFSIAEFLRSDAADKYQVSNMPADEELLAVLKLLKIFFVSVIFLLTFSFVGVNMPLTA